METITIPKINILDLIKNKECQYYEDNIYSEITIKVIEGSYSDYNRENGTINLTFGDLAKLLFDRNCSNDALTIIVV